MRKKDELDHFVLHATGSVAKTAVVDDDDRVFLAAFQTIIPFGLFFRLFLSI
jgi:hypothetical protein